MSDRNLNAYYYGFDSTGHDAIDAILEAVARAGKAYHHTDQWDEPWEYGDEGGPSFTDVMQQRAQSAADRLAKLEDGIRALADKYHNADAKQPGAVVRADTFESELRALLDD